VQPELASALREPDAPGDMVADVAIPPPLSPAQLVRRICAQSFGVTEADILGTSRKGPISVARQATCYVLRRRFAHLSYPAIAKMMRRDHTSIIFAVQQTEARMQRNPALARKIAKLIAEPILKMPENDNVFSGCDHHNRSRRGHPAADFADTTALRHYIPPNRIWCGQCDRAVLISEARKCRRAMCGARPQLKS